MAAGIKPRSIFTEPYKSVPIETVDAVVIGAGVVGIAVARELAVKLGREVLVIESGPTFGTGSSSRNSEVIHAGIYYPRNSLKALFCVRGRHLLYKYCKEHDIPHKQIGKLIGEAENHGAVFSYSTTVIGGKYEENRLQLYVSESKTLKNWDGKSPPKPDLILSPRIVVNSAGLGALALSRRFHGLDDGIIPRPYFARGCYFTLSNVKSPPFRHLIYPVPEDGGLGVHVTLDLNGQVRFGPDVEWIDGVDDISSFLNLFDYSVAGDRANRFYPEIRKYYPCLKDGALEPGYAGIRPKLSGAMQGEDIHGIQGLINLFGIESPGLTSSMAIAEHVAAVLSR
ncbi:hypothetical protein DH2020_041384 [Rehmannia glutinosa]|uniref:L-2-hydroxyglutarate dehydrogenase, mitochondrial n=1 Tax=Rehmannia glutinosa TaxID=99300 RepID=A0ABR0UR03_REHGL